MKINKKISDLTVIIITNKNDDKFIQSLKSAQIAEKVLVVDNNSDNNWRKLKTTYEFKLLSHEKKISNFSKIRNEALESVKTPWVFFLDSDESLGKTKEEQKNNKLKIKKIIEDDLYAGVAIVRQDIFHSKALKYGEASDTKIIRLFKADKGKFTRNVHEVAKIDGSIGSSEIIVSHFSHENIAEFFMSISKYAKLASKNERSTLLENIIKMVLFPVAKFVQNYILKLGFLDGYRGFIYAFIMSLHSFFVRVFYFEKYFQENQHESKT